jgi:TatD DNase family protein
MGIDLESSKKAIQLAEQYPGVLAAVGFHPHEVADMKKEDVTALAELSRHPKVVAIGEIGLDFYRSYSSRETQLRAVRWQLELAADLDLPVVIHCRQAQRDMVSLLTEWCSHRHHANERPVGVIHCFSSDQIAAERYLELGFCLSVAAPITYPSSRHTFEMIRSIPLDRLLVETDSPFLPTQNRRGKRNEPSYLPIIVEKLAQIREASFSAVAKDTAQNAFHLFRLPGMEKQSQSFHEIKDFVE